MAVEIPVVIDIDKAFEDAAKRVDSAIKPLRSKIDKETANLTLKVGVIVDDEGETQDIEKSIEQLLGKIKDKSRYIATPIQELTTALSYAKDEYSALESKAARYNKLNRDDNKRLVALREAIVLLTQEIEQRQHGVSLIERETQDAINAKRAEEQRLAIIQKSATTMSQMQAKLGALQGEMQNAEIGSSKWLQLLDDVKAVESEIERVNKDIRDLGMESGSLNSLNAQMSDLQQKFSQMSSKKLFNADGSATQELRDIQQQYAKVRLEADKVSQALTEEYETQKKATQEAQANAEAKRRQAEAEAEHQRALHDAASTLDQYNAKIAAWRKELSTATIGSDEFTNAAIQVELLSQKMAELSNQIKILGSAPKSINELSAKIQEINRQYNELSKSDRLGAKGKSLLQQYRQISKELEKEGKSLQQIVAEEQRLASLKEKNLGRQKYENAILNTKVKTMRILQEQERILSDRLSRTEIGTAKYKQLEDQIRRVRYEMQQATGASTNLNKSLSAQTGIFSSLNGQITAYASAFGVLRFARQIRDVTAELEFQRIALSRLIQDEEYGAILFDKIKNAAVESPFRITDLVTYTKQLAAYRVEQENLFSTTKMLADVSAGLGVDMNRLILAYGQVRAASVLRGQELRQFTEAGIPLVELLAEKFSDLRGEMVTTADVFKLISDRAVPFSMISDIFVDMTEKGGMFYEMQKKQSETLKGRWEKLKDTFDIALQSIGDTGYFRYWNKVLIDSLTFLANHLILVPKLLSAVTYGWIAWNAAILLSTKRTVAKINADKMLMAEMTAQNAKVGKLTISILGEAKARGLLTNAIYKQSVANNVLTRTFWKLWAAMLSNPITAIIAGIAALTAAFLTFRKKTDATVESVKNFEDSISEMSEANKKFKRMEGTIKVYERLASKTERTSDENIRLAKTMDKLKETFPELTSLINQDNIALDEKVKKLKEVNAEQLKAVRDSKESELESAKVFIKNLTGEKLKKQDIVDRIGESLKVYRAAEKEGLKVFEEEDLMGRKRFVKRYDLPTDEIITSEENIRKKINEVNAEYNKQKSELEEINSELRTWETRAERLNKQLYPEEVIKGWTEWQKLIKSTQDGIISEGQAPLFTDDDISGLESVYELFNKLKKSEKEHTENLNGMNAALSKMTEGEAKQNLQKDIESEKRLLQTIKALKDVFGFDFSKGGENKYLQDLRNRINDITNAYKKYIELLKYMGKDKAMENIRTFFPSLDFEPTYDEMVKKLERMLASYKGDADATRIIEQALANIKYDNLKKSLEDNLKKLSAEIKRSETARNFYNEILGMTGDEQFAATMTMNIYGDIGDEFKERMQKELNGLLDSLKSDTSFSVTPDIENAFKNMDFKTLLALDNLPDEIRKRLQEAYASAQKYDRDFITDLVKSYQKARTYEERIRAVRDRESKKREEIIADKKIPESEKVSLINASQEKQEREIADIEVERIKNMYVWTKTFEDLGNVSDKTLKQLIANLNLLIEKQGSAMSPEALKAVTQARDKAYDMVGERNPYAGIIKGLRDWGNATKKVNKLRREGKRGTIDELKALDEQKKAWNDAVKSASHLKDGLETLGNAVSALSELFDYDETQGVKYVLDGIAEALTLVGTALVFVNAMMELLASNPLIIGATAIIALITAIVKAIEGARLSRINKEIERQQKLIDELERSYEQLEEAIQGAFGTEYVYKYNQMLENLYASAEAYRKQAEEERKKGKKANKDTISEHEKNAEEAIKKTSELTKELREFFAGENLASAAESFADSWLQAYREFGDTAGAIEERMHEMIDNLIKRSLLSEIAKNILGNWYQSISDIKVWDAETVAKKWEEAEQLITPMVEAFKITTSQLQEQGKSLRGTAGSFTGIARNIANASEESINGLAAGINTQNYYMQHIDQVVSAILLQLGGKSDVSYEVQQYNPYQQAVLGSLGKLTTIDENIAQILTTLKSVVSTATSAPQNRIYIH